MENRLRFHQEIIRAVRSAVGNDFPIAAFKIRSLKDYLEGGNTVEVGVKAAENFNERKYWFNWYIDWVLGYIVKEEAKQDISSDVSKETQKISKIPVILTRLE